MRKERVQGEHVPAAVAGGAGGRGGNSAPEARSTGLSGYVTGVRDRR